MNTTLNITGMTCGHCVGAVKKALESVPGVHSADVSLEDGQATVQGDASPEALIQAVQQEGYSAAPGHGAQNAQSGAQEA